MSRFEHDLKKNAGGGYRMRYRAFAPPFASVTLIIIILVAQYRFVPAEALDVSHISYCGCVIFRIDDIQGNWNSVLQKQMLQIFIDNGIPATLGIVMQPYGDDKDIVSIVRKGNDLGLFDLALHGWRHVDYTTLSRQEQYETLSMAQAKFERIHGFATRINIMPYNRYDNDTLAVMKELHLTVVSADKNMPSGYVAKYNVIGIPDTQNFKDRTNQDLMPGIRSDIEKYGYSMVLLHAHEFRLNGQDNVINEKEFHRLSDLMDMIKSEDIHFTTLTEMAFGQKPPRATLPILGDEPAASDAESGDDGSLIAEDSEILRPDDVPETMPVNNPIDGIRPQNPMHNQINPITVTIFGMTCVWISILDWFGNM